MTIQEILEHLTILKITTTDITSFAYFGFVAAISWALFAIFFFLKRGDTTATTLFTVLGIISVVLAVVGAIASIVLLIYGPQVITSVTLNVIADDSITLKELTDYFNVTDISTTKSGEYMTLQVDSTHRAFESIVAVLRTIGAIT